MKKTCIALVLFILTLFCFSACQTSTGYQPMGEFYIKTSPSNGDAGVRNVISIEAEYKTYQSDADLMVPMTVGLGHLPDSIGYGEDANDTFYVLYRIIESPWSAEKAAVWEKKIAYTDSWYDEKYNSTEQKNPPSFLWARYGEFYPLYKENVEFFFPASVEKGYVQVWLFAVIPDREEHQFFGIQFSFTRKNGVLTLEEKI